MIRYLTPVIHHSNALHIAWFILSTHYMGNSDFRPLLPADVERASDIISQAFMQDPLCTFMLPVQRTRARTLRKFFRAYGTVHIQGNYGYGTGEPLIGVAFWLQPSRPDVSVGIRSLALFLPLLFTHYPLGYFRAREILKQIDLLHRKYASAPHYYLDNLAVLPSEWGKGYASHLIRPILEQADQEKVSVYTDTVTQANVGLYQHFGFQCMQAAPVASTEITVWSLLRPVQ